MKDAFVMSREELLAKTGTDSEKGLNPEQVEKSRRVMNLWQKEFGMHPQNRCWLC